MKEYIFEGVRFQGFLLFSSVVFGFHKNPDVMTQIALRDAGFKTDGKHPRCWWFFVGKDVPEKVALKVAFYVFRLAYHNVSLGKPEEESDENAGQIPDEPFNWERYLDPDYPNGPRGGQE